MRILIACLQFPMIPGGGFMTTELAQALVAAGHEVEVLQIDWDGPRSAGPVSERIWNEVRVVTCPPRWVEGLGTAVRAGSKFVLTAGAAGRATRRRFDLSGFDVFLAWAPALAVAPVARLARRMGVPRRVLMIWDFFPDHYREIGRIPGGPAYWTARAWEQRLMDHFTAFLCTLPQNADYLRRRFRVRPHQSVGVTPIWSDLAPAPDADRAAVRRAHGLPLERPIAVFGGQLNEGRGFDQMLAAAALGRATGSPLLFLFVGDGRLAPRLREAAHVNLAWRPPLTRDAYLELLRACDVGLVATVPGVSSFSFPSKTIDYLRAGLPVAAAVEPGSGYGALLERRGVGRSVAFGDGLGFLRAAEALAEGPSIAGAARSCLDDVFDVRHAVAAVLGGG